MSEHISPFLPDNDGEAEQPSNEMQGSADAPVPFGEVRLHVENRLIFYARTLVRMRQQRQYWWDVGNALLSGEERRGRARANIAEIDKVMQPLIFRAEGLEEALLIMEGKQPTEPDWVSNAINKFGPKSTQG